MRSAFCLFVILLAGSYQSPAQTGPLNLGQILSELQSKSSVITLAQKNEAITKSVRERGVTFKPNAEIEKELRNAGASTTLISAIRAKAPGTSTTGAKPDASLESLRIENNEVEKGLSGVRIIANFRVYNLKEVSSDIVYRIQSNGTFLKGSNPDYSTKSGELSARRLLRPSADSTVFKDLAAFLPYKELGLPAGTHAVKIDADVILRDGTMVKHLTLQDASITVPSNLTPAPTSTGGSAAAKFEKIWIDYDVTQEGSLGMLVHVTATISGMKDKEAYLQLLFEKSDGTALKTSTTRFRSPDGQTAGYSSLKPIYDSARFNDIKVFVPYSEFNLPVGKHRLRIHADVVNTDYSQLGHLTYHDFEYTRNR
ncbi:MAG: hypothetical protein DWQ47_16385 [Acidobacteria bacterium]|nr:MAG: hypothetical protein DWQ32_03785 [Acidobacteriota bacterium]REK02370.1 MAG: hypothetical protein DWQ38_08355 [Acidobacteriota bacterium]REK13828.1 MAG: hypothetical protein DWQ43_09475 [Acidobacteriota bacterium]REK41823.1 MAG: hypothetical protein DWQ47_16385 [Acidobacteriota bacterium]